MKTLRLIVLFIMSICTGMLSVHSASAQTSIITYDQPLAYVGADGNVYITSLDGTSTTPITSDGSPRGYGFEEDSAYGAFRWSPDGTQVVFTHPTSSPRLYVAASDQKPAILLPDISIGYRVSAWSPDGKQIAFISGGGPGNGGNELQVVSAKGGTPHKITDVGGCIGDGPGPEHARWVVADERDDAMFASMYRLQWTSKGIVLSSTMADCGIATLFSADGKSTIWQNDTLEDLIVSPDETQAVAYQRSSPEPAGPVLVDLSNGKTTPLSLPAGATVLAWTGDGRSLLYETRDLLQEVIEGDPNWSQETHDNYLLTLWRQPLVGGQPVKLFQHEGYDFGAVTVAPDNSTVVVSLVINSYFVKNEPELQIVAIPMNGGTPNWIAVGGRPAFGKGPFAAVPAGISAGAVQAVTCPESGVSRLRVGQRAKVSPGAPNNLRASPRDGERIHTLPGGSIFLVLDGPSCGADGLIWWKVNYQGVIGWTAESDQNAYWLEP